MFRRWSIIISFFLSILLLAPKAIADNTRVGVIAPLTGGGAFWGENFRKGIELAVRDLSANNENIEVIFEDDQCDPKTAVSAYQKLRNVDHVNYFLGPVCSSAVLAVAPLVAREKAPLIACAESADIPFADGYLFRLWVPNDRQGKVLARYAAENGHRAAVVAIDNSFGSSFSRAFREEYLRLGGTVVSTADYDPTQLDFRAILLRTRSSSPDILVMASYIPDGIALYRQIQESGMKAQVLASSTVNSADFFEPLGGLTENLVIVDIEDTTATNFRDRWQKEFSKPWPGQQSCASAGYDGVRILNKIVREAHDNPNAAKAALTAMKNFDGIIGPITFDSNGSLSGTHKIFVRHGGKLKMVP